MTPTERRACLDELYWTQRMFALVIDWPEGEVRGWMRGRGDAPPEIDEWLARRARGMIDDPPPIWRVDNGQ